MQTDTHADRPRLADADHARLNQLVAGDHPRAVIVIGGGDEHLLDEILNLLPATNVLTLEPLATVARRLLARPTMVRRIQEGRLLVLAGPDYAGATDAWRLFGDVVAMPPIFVEPILASQHATDVATAKVAAAKIVLGAKQNGEARRKFAGPYLLNTLTNLPVIARESDVRALFELMSGVPAVIVAAGPSLDRNIDELKAMAGRALIVAVDTAVRPLLTAGIRPHLAVSVDPSEVNARHLKDLPDTRDISLVAEGSLYPTALAPFAGRTFAYNVSQHHPWPWLAAQGIERGALQAWGSVITTTLDLVCRMGCNPIVFAGADLAYTRRLLYCRNTTYEAGWSHLTTDDARAEFFEQGYFKTQPTTVQRDVHGADTACTTQFVQFRDWLVARANAASDRRIINATGGGILHGGRIQLADLKNVLRALPVLEADLTQRLERAWKGGVKAGAEKSMKRGLEHVLQQRDDQLQRWIAFGKDTVSPEDVTERINFAVDALTTAARGQLLHWRERAKVHTAEVDTTTLQSLQQERDVARSTRDTALVERDAAREERDQALASRDLLQIARDAAMAARDAALVDRDTALAARDAALAKSDRSLAERDLSREQRDSACAERDALLARLSAGKTELDAEVAALNAALAMQNSALAERDIALTAQDAALAARDAALAKADAALLDRDAALALADAALVDRDAALTRADAALAARDMSFAERDAARAARDLVSAELDALRPAQVPADDAQIERYLNDLRAFYDDGAADLESARDLSHGNFDLAARRAASQQTFALMDFLQRTYAAVPGRMVSSLAAAGTLPAGLRVLDVGCGVGRQMVPLAEAGLHVDGVDISARMIEFARQDSRLSASEFFVSNGRDCGAAPEGAYDLVHSQVCFRYIPSRRIRQSLLEAMARSLRPGGVVMVELRFFPAETGHSVPAPHVPWSRDLDGTVAAGAVDVHATPDELHLIYQDFARYFSDLRLQIVDMPPAFKLTHPPYLIVTGSREPGLASRIHATEPRDGAER